MQARLFTRRRSEGLCQRCAEDGKVVPVREIAGVTAADAAAAPELTEA
ncbi:MAG: hypothetical protein ACE366_20055 [Bradymonadia bacterium]